MCTTQCIYQKVNNYVRCTYSTSSFWVGVMFSHPWTVPVALPDKTESVMILLNWRVSSAGVNWSWMVKGAIKSPSSTVLVFHRNWTWIGACVSNYKISNVCFLILHHAANKFVSIYIQLSTLTIIIQDGNLDQVQKKLVLLQLQKWQSSLSPPQRNHQLYQLQDFEHCRYLFLNTMLIFGKPDGNLHSLQVGRM